MHWDEQLNDEQRVAASASLAHHCVLAGPGTGKTRALTHRVAYLQQVHNVPLEHILVLTFTRAAAAELRARLREDFGEEYALVRVSTVHAFALRQLVRNDAAPAAPDRVVIADDIDETEVIFQDLRRALGWHDVRQVREAINKIAAGWAQLQADDPNWEAMHELAPLLAALRQHRGTYGYVLRAELVYRLYRALRARPNFNLERFDHVLVDEYQDLTECELRVVRELTEHGALLFAAGDDDQSIYGWREATPAGIRRFEGDYGAGSFVRLAECQRCDRDIVALAALVIAQDRERIPKDVHPASHLAGTIECRGCKGDKSEAARVARMCADRTAAGVRPEHVMVLVRSGREINRITEALERLDLEISREVDPYAQLRTRAGRRVSLFIRLVIDEDEHLAWRQFLRLGGFGDDVVRAYHDEAIAQGTKFADLLGQVNRRPDHVALPRVAAVAAFVADTLDKVTRFREGHAGDLTAQLELLVGLALDQPAPALVGLLAQAATEVAAEGGAPPSWKDAALALAGQRGGVDEQHGATPGIRVMTMHGAKGLGADTVILAGADHEVMHGGAAGPAWYEEVRLLYVAITRAIHYLAVTFPGRRTGEHLHRRGGEGAHRLSDALSDFLNPIIE